MSIEIIECEQGSPEWFKARLGIPTASEFHTVMAKGTGGGPSKTRRKYMLTLIAEHITGEMAESYSNAHMERGKAMEPEARAAYAFIQNVDPMPVGFIRNGTKGASPDSLIDATGLLEIKTKLPHLHLELLLGGEIPSEHKAQVQGQLWVAEREFCDFVCYWPKLPLFVKRVTRDELYIKTIAIAVDIFLNEMAVLEQSIRNY